MLGYPSRHVLFDQVKNPGRKPKTKRREEPVKRYDQEPKRSARSPMSNAPMKGPVKRYGWELKSLAVSKVLDGAGVKDVAEELGVTNRTDRFRWTAFDRFLYKSTRSVDFMNRSKRIRM